MGRFKILILGMISLLICILSSNVGMFWDNVLFAGKMGKHIYENVLFSWRIPVAFDPGHPPFLATYLAFGWKIFGKSLLVSHLLMAPFIFGLLLQINNFIHYFIKDEKLSLMAIILVVADPTLLSQLVLVNPEVIQLFFFFVALNAVLSGKFIVKTIGLAFLGLVTYRGMMLCAGIFFIDFVMRTLLQKEKVVRFFSITNIASYTLGALPALAFVIWRLFFVGWLQAHPDSPWAELWRMVTLKEFFRNVLVLTHRFVDFGRVFILSFVMLSIYIKRQSLDNEKFLLILITFLSTIVIVITSVLSTNAMGHRYFIASYLPVILLAFMFLQEYRHKMALYFGLLIALIAGNFIIYPDSVAQGWDASLAHLPYWKIRSDAIEFLDSKNINIVETASFFPNATEVDNVELNGDNRSFVNFTGSEEYVFYSNVYNVSDSDLNILNSNYRIIKLFIRCGVRIEILQLKKIE